MNKKFTVELIDNGIIIREENDFVEAVLYNEDNYADEEAQYSDCYIEIGKRIIRDLFNHDGNIAKESKELYDKTGKYVIGFKIEMDIVPITKPEEMFI